MVLASQLAPSLAAKKETSPLKTRVRGSRAIASGRFIWTLNASGVTATGSGDEAGNIASGRAYWLSRDPIGEKGGLNLYGYVGDDPVNDMDPLGLTSYQLPNGWNDFDCCQLGDLVKQMINFLRNQYTNMRIDKHGLYNNPNAVPRAQGGAGTWDGHQDDFKATQDKLRDVLNKANTMNCGDKIPSNAWGWATENAPSKPAPEGSVNRFINAVPNWATTGGEYGAWGMVIIGSGGIAGEIGGGTVVIGGGLQAAGAAF